MAQIKFIPIVPKIAKLIDETKIKRELRFALRSVGTTVKNDFVRTIRTWSNKPSFVQRGPLTLGDRITISVSTGNKIYLFLTRGTRKNYPIPRSPKTVGFLRFRTGYRAKTRPRVIGSRGGGAFGPFASAKQVIHPGIDARDFDKEIAKRRQKTLVKQFRNAILRSLRL